MLTLDQLMDIDTICNEVHKQLFNDGYRNTKMVMPTTFNGGSSGGMKRGPKAKPILQYTKDGQFVKEWESAEVAIRETNISSIRSCTSGVTRTAGGFMWKYKHS